MTGPTDLDPCSSPSISTAAARLDSHYRLPRPVLHLPPDPHPPCTSTGTWLSSLPSSMQKSVPVPTAQPGGDARPWGGGWFLCLRPQRPIPSAKTASWSHGADVDLSKAVPPAPHLTEEERAICRPGAAWSHVPGGGQRGEVGRGPIFLPRAIFSVRHCLSHSTALCAPSQQPTEVAACTCTGASAGNWPEA